MEHEDIIRRWLEGSLTDDEMRDQLGPNEYDNLRKLTASLNYFRAPDFQKEKIWKSLEQLRKKKEVGYFSVRSLMKVAAIIIAIIGLSYYFAGYEFKGSEEGTANKREVILRDNSRVILNANSDLSYNSGDFDRTVTIKGEAYFEVSTGPGFKVNTPNTTVTVLGTGFNVIDHDDGFLEVTCFEGRVAIVLDKTEYHIAHNESLRQLNGQVEKLRTNRNRPSWLDGKSSFKEIPFGFVLKEFERQYKVTITTENIDIDRLYTGSFSNNDTLLALETITTPFDVKFRIENDVIVLTRAD